MFLEVGDVVYLSFNLAIEILVISGQDAKSFVVGAVFRFNLAIEILVISGPFPFPLTDPLVKSFNLAIEILVISGQRLVGGYHLTP